MLAEGLHLGKYRLVRLIGHGATGVVYLAEDARIARQIALKIVHSEHLSGEAMAELTRLFEHEARIIAGLNHPNILPLFDFGDAVINGTTLTYLVTPFCPEGALTIWLRQNTGVVMMQPQDALAVVQQASDALEYAHDRQVIHRDVKPSNFLVRSRKETPTCPDILLADFGIACINQATVLLSKTIRGTPVYMAPEQWSGNAVMASDQYALAIMAYELLTGRPPFYGTQDQIMYHHLMTTPTPPSAINARLAPAIDVVLLQALAKKPEERFPSIRAFAQALRQAIGEPTTNPNSIGTSTTPVSRVTLSQPTPSVAGPVSPTPSAPLTPTPSTPIAAPIAPLVSASSSSTPPAASKPLEPAVVVPAMGAASNDVRTTLSISTTEAMAGTRKRVTLPNGQSVTVTIPAGAQDGHIIMLANQLNAQKPDMPKGNVFITLSVSPTTDAPLIQSIPGMKPTRIPWKLVLPLGLIVVLLIAALSSIYLLGTKSFPSNTATNSSTVVAQQNSSATATAGAIGATATAQSNADATTVVANNPYDMNQQTLVQASTLDKNDSANWDEKSGACVFTGGSYHVVSPGSGVQSCFARALPLSDFTFRVQMTMLKGNSGGLLLRASSQAAYYFQIDTSGYYALLLCNTTGMACSKTLLNNFSSAIITSGSRTNVLAVVAKGKHFDLYVNGERIDGADDGTSLSGQVGLVASTSSEVVFSNAKVWKA